MNHKIKFNLGQIVYLVTDCQQKERIVTGVMLRPNNQVVYYLSCGEEEANHYDIEITDKKDIVKSIS